MINKLLLPIGLIIISGVLFITGLFATGTEAFLFPNFVSGVMCAISVLILVNNLKSHENISRIKSIPWLVILPAMVIFVLYLGFVEHIGFYVTSYIAFVAIVLIYIPDQFSIPQTGKILSIGLAFMGALYSLFTVLLKVQLPRGLFF